MVLGAIQSRPPRAPRRSLQDGPRPRFRSLERPRPSRRGSPALLPFLIWRHVLSYHWRVVAGGLLALWPGQVFVSGVVLQDNWVLIPTIALACLAVRRLRDPAARGRPLTSALLYGAGLGIRQEMAIVLIPLALVAGTSPAGSGSRRRDLARFGIPVVVILLALAAQRRLATGKAHDRDGSRRARPLRQLRARSERPRLDRRARLRSRPRAGSSARPLRFSVPARSTDLPTRFDGARSSTPPASPPGCRASRSMPTPTISPGASGILARFRSPRGKPLIGSRIDGLRSFGSSSPSSRAASPPRSGSRGAGDGSTSSSSPPPWHSSSRSTCSSLRSGASSLPAVALELLALALAGEALSRRPGRERLGAAALAVGAAAVLLFATPLLADAIIRRDPSDLPGVRAFALDAGDGCVLRCELANGRLTGLSPTTAWISGRKARVDCLVPTLEPDASLGLRIEGAASVSTVIARAPGSSRGALPSAYPAINRRAVCR